MHRQANVKRRRQDGAQPLKHGGKRANRMDWQDEEISSNDEEEGNGLESEQESDDYEESAESKRLRLAKQYLSQMKAGDADEDSASDASSDDARVSNKLKTTRLRERGELFEDLVPHFRSLDVEECTRRDLTGHTGAITCISLTKDETTMVSSSKDNSVLKWDVETGSKTVLRQKWNSTMDYQSSMGEMLSVAVSHDGRYVAAGGRDSSVRIYDQRQKYAEVKELKGHRGAVTSLCFRMDSYTLFSSSLDRCMKHWEINDLAYVETMFGHQVGVPSLPPLLLIMVFLTLVFCRSVGWCASCGLLEQREATVRVERPNGASLEGSGGNTLGVSRTQGEHRLRAVPHRQFVCVRRAGRDTVPVEGHPEAPSTHSACRARPAAVYGPYWCWGWCWLECELDQQSRGG